MIDLISRRELKRGGLCIGVPTKYELVIFHNNLIITFRQVLLFQIRFNHPVMSPRYAICLFQSQPSSIYDSSPLFLCSLAPTKSQHDKIHPPTFYIYPRLGENTFSDQETRFRRHRHRYILQNLHARRIIPIVKTTANIIYQSTYARKPSPYRWISKTHL